MGRASAIDMDGLGMTRLAIVGPCMGGVIMDGVASRGICIVGLSMNGFYMAVINKPDISLIRMGG